MKEYMLIDEYEKLYARYNPSAIGEMISMAGSVKGRIVWDFCCGNGAISKECIKREASRVIAVDMSCAMTRRLFEDLFNSGTQGSRSVRLEIAEVEDFLSTASEDVHGSPDLVFCKQGINYWFNKQAVSLLASRMGTGSVFLFNTFNTEPSRQPRVKEYELGGSKFIEVSWLVDGTVHHVQIREGMPHHATSFQWIPGETFRQVLGKYFTVGESVNGRTTMYRCVRK